MYFIVFAFYIITPIFTVPLACWYAEPQNDESRLPIPSFLKMHLIASYFPCTISIYATLCFRRAAQLLPQTQPHAGVTTSEPESWLPQEVLRNMPHCLFRSIPQPEYSITYDVRNFLLNMLSESCMQVVFHTVMFTVVSPPGLGCGMKM